MALEMPSLSLTPFWKLERLLLVRATDAIRLCDDGSYEKLPPGQALPHVQRAERRWTAEARDFVARTQLSSRPLCDWDDARLLEQLGQWLKVGALVVVRGTEEGAGNQTPSLLKQRRVLRALGQKRNALRFESRTYRIVADADLGRIFDRDDYEVVSHAEAMRVLSGLARQAVPQEAGLLLQEAHAQLTPDWHSPMSPDGIVLLRKIPVRQSGPNREPSLGKPRPTSSGPAESEEPAEEEACRPCAALREAKQAEALRQASQDGAPFCADCGPPPAAAA
jgi:hypothetical protein